MIPVQLVELYRGLRDWVQGRDAHDRALELTGSLLANKVRSMESIGSLRDVEFRVYSQWGDDGIIQWLVGRLPGLPRRFVEFGVEDYTESNTRFLMVNNHWSGLVLDGSARNMTRLAKRKWFWRHDLTARHCFVTKTNVNQVIGEWAGNSPVGLLHVDVDGNDYWFWQAITCITPGIVIMEYNAVFGPDRPVTVPYDDGFRRFLAHYSGQFAGASLPALCHLADSKGYALVGTNGAGNNAYFVRRDLLINGISEVSASEAYTAPCFRESRDKKGGLNFKSLHGRQEQIRGMTVWNVVTSQSETF